MRTADFHFDLPSGLIAQHPAPQRDESRLLVLHRATGNVEHGQFLNLPGFFRAGDVLVLNQSRVIPARLRGANARTGGKFEILLLEENAANDWWAMLRPGKSARVGTQIVFPVSKLAGIVVCHSWLTILRADPSTSSATANSAQDDSESRLDPQALAFQAFRP